MGATLNDVALRAGVSRSAVSRTFTQGASVSAKTRRKVEKAAADLGYSPSLLASSLTTGRTKLVGLVSNNFHNPIFLEIFDLFTRGLQDQGLRPLLVNLSDETDPSKSLRMLGQYWVDAVVVASSTLPPAFAAAYRAAGVPVVHAFGRHAPAPEVSIVGVDNVHCGRMAAEILLSRGYARIGFLGGPEAATSTQDRLAGFRAALDRAPGVTLTHSFARDYSFDAGRAEMQRQIQAGPAEAYFCGDDVLSIGALSALQSAGLRVPDEVGLLGFNDMEIARWDNIWLTTIKQPIREIVEASIELVAAMLENPDRPPEARLYDCRLIERGTLRPVPATA